MSFIRSERGAAIVIRTLPAMMWMLRMPPPPSVPLFIHKDVMWSLKRDAGYKSVPSHSNAVEAVVRDAGGGNPRPAYPGNESVGSGAARPNDLQAGPPPQHDSGGSDVGTATVARRRRIGVPNHPRNEAGSKL